MFEKFRFISFRFLYFIIGIIIIVISVFALWHSRPQELKAPDNGFVSNNTPTIFIHGWSSSLMAERDMVTSAEVRGVARKRMIIRVRSNGKILVTGDIKKWMRNPIIMLQFDNNRAGEVQYAHWLTKVCKLLKAKYHVNNLNFVGHSMGAYAAVYYNLLNGNQSDLPRTQKMCLIAGPYDGIIDNHKANQPTSGPLKTLWDDKPNQNRLLADGRPKIIHPEYKKLYRLRNNFPHQVRVLNIFGNIGDGSNSDGVVTATSALSLRYILRDKVNFYQTFESFGAKSQHSALHDNNLAVNRQLTEFIWAKNYQPGAPNDLQQ
ncbi:alpha/beta hydrolase [Lentilactobacillus sp. SPB1-3]|uniref:Alpha/beta hydrolase n=1 Tax=Lentilactobacillus terminaliae TaxID=3003483 RepID=A0ACD5DHB5_9LACO|nr:alpha/beta hydrolase [Lentilactobacillus sp. SPB1-3]MCZ0977013.1 alpha/beta hydrolase [Lentilactobacillus sp. SPB1-3]